MNAQKPKRLIMHYIVFDTNIFIIPDFSYNYKMVKRIGGIRRKTRYKLRKEKRKRGKISLSNYFQSFNVGDRVSLGAEPAVQKGSYNFRFMGKAGVIIGKRGNCYEVSIKDGGKEKMLIVHPIHLRTA